MIASIPSSTVDNKKVPHLHRDQWVFCCYSLVDWLSYWKLQSTSIDINQLFLFGPFSIAMWVRKPESLARSLNSWTRLCWSSSPGGVGRPRLDTRDSSRGAGPAVRQLRQWESMGIAGFHGGIIPRNGLFYWWLLPLDHWITGVRLYRISVCMTVRCVFDVSSMFLVFNPSILLNGILFGWVSLSNPGYRHILQYFEIHVPWFFTLDDVDCIMFNVEEDGSSGTSTWQWNMLAFNREYTPVI